MDSIIPKSPVKNREVNKRFLLASFFLLTLTFFLHFHDLKVVFFPLSFAGSFLLSLMFTFWGAIYLKLNHKEIFYSFHKLALLVTVCILSLLIAKGLEFAAHYKVHFLMENMHYPLLVPFGSILVCLLLGSEVAIFTSFFLTLICGTFLDVDNLQFLVLNFVTSLVGILSAKKSIKQKEIFSVCIKVWLSSAIVIMAFHFTQNNMSVWGDLSATFVFMLATSLMIIAILPVLESSFNVMTDMTLMEFADPSSPLLRRLSLEAPGTYQHSLVVGNLAENAARAIHADGLFCRISSLYHDIGKLFNPHYFNENQLGGLNIHQLLTPKESAQVIMTHIGEGECLARKHRLPKSFIDVIKEHHGTSFVKYFYEKQLALMKDDPSSVNPSDFSYQGPKPHTKESAIIMIADKVEAASRSLVKVTEESIAKMVESLVSEKMHDGQLDDCQLTFEELSIVKKEMIKTLVIARHLRVL